MNASFDIRRASSADAPALTRVAHAATRYWRYPEEMILFWKDRLTVSEDFIARCPVFCAVKDGAVVGFYGLSGGGETRELRHFWVLPEHMGQGVGTALFEHALFVLRDAGVRAIRIESDPHTEGFFRKMGARRIGDAPSVPEGRTVPLLEFALR